MKTILAVIALAILSGCATITTSEMQSVAVTARDERGTRVDQADCVLKNERGEWKTSAPSQVSVRKSSEDLIVTCAKQGYPVGFVRAISRAGAGMFGNIILGGAIGAVIDHSKGVAYNYPDELAVIMGQSITLDRWQGAPEQPALVPTSPAGPVTVAPPVANKNMSAAAPPAVVTPPRAP